MSERICKKCGEAMEPVQFASSMQVTLGVFYADNLCALDAMVADLQRGWCCRGTCEAPVPIDDKPEANEEWDQAMAASSKRLYGRPHRCSSVYQPGGPAFTQDDPVVKLDVRQRMWCDDCGHRWTIPIEDALDSSERDICPECGALALVDTSGPEGG